MNDLGQKISCIGRKIPIVMSSLLTSGCGWCISYSLTRVYSSITSAKHLHSPDEQLHSVAGSLGYVAPEVLKKDGHGKPVDIWAIGRATSLTSH